MIQELEANDEFATEEEVACGQGARCCNASDQDVDEQPDERDQRTKPSIHDVQDAYERAKQADKNRESTYWKGYHQAMLAEGHPRGHPYYVTPFSLPCGHHNKKHLYWMGVSLS